MSEITCPYCAATLFDSELAAGECTSCMQKLPRRVSGPSYRRSGQGGLDVREVKAWQTVRTGVSRLAWCVSAEAAMGLLFGAGLVGLKDHFGGYQNGADGLLLLLFFGLVGAGVGGLISWVLTLLAPAHSGLRLHAIGSGAMLPGGILVAASPFALAALTRNSMIRQFEWLLWLMLFTGIVLVVADWIWYCVYLRGVARYFGNGTLGVNFLALGVVSGSLLVMGVAGMLVLQEVLRFRHRDLEELATVGLWLGGVSLLVWLGVDLFRLHRLIPSLDRQIRSLELD
jgi:hypothetical protein